MKDLLKKHKARLPQLNILKYLYEERYFDLFNIDQFEYFNDKNDYLFLGFHKALTDIMGIFTFSGGLTISYQEDDINAKLDDFLTESKLINKLKSITRNASIYGDGVIQLVLNNDDINVIIHPTEAWEPIPNPLGDAYPPLGHCIIREIEKSKKKYTLVESHYAGRIEYTAYNEDMYQVDIVPLFAEELKDLRITASLSSKTMLVEETGFDFPLVFQIKNVETFDSLYGESDYTLGSVSKVKKINEILNQRQYVIRQHGHPKMIVPRALIAQTVRQLNEANDDDQNAGNELNFEDATLIKQTLGTQRSATETYIAQQLIKKMEFMPDDSIDGTSQFRYLEYNGKLDESEKQYEMLKSRLEIETAFPRLMTNEDISIGNLSGEALKRLLSVTLAKVQDKRDALTDTIKMIIYTVMQIKGIKAEYPQVTFGDPITPSLMERIEANEKMLNSSITSQRKAIMDVQKTTNKETDELIKEIKEEQDLFVEPVGNALAIQSNE